MKKFFIMIMFLTMGLMLVACQNSNQTNEPNSTSNNTLNQSTTQIDEIQTPIVLKIGDVELDAYLNNSSASQSLISQLPMDLTLADSDNDFCGGNLELDYSEEDVTYGYRNGDIALWTVANNFVIFVSDEETSSGTGNLVNLGRITSSQEMLDDLRGAIEVRIELKTQDNISYNLDELGDSVNVKITVDGTELLAVFENNATTQALLEQMPMTLSMDNLYSREMCYRFGAYALPTDNLITDNYEVGDIAYWAPGGSLVILYEQNFEQFERQHIGHIETGVEIFRQSGTKDVSFEIVEQ